MPLFSRSPTSTLEGAKQFLQEYLDARVNHEETWRSIFEKNLKKFFSEDYLDNIQSDWNIDSEIETVTDHYEDDGCWVFETTGYGMGNKRYYLAFDGAGWKIDSILSVCDICGGEDTEECEDCEECEGTGWLEWVD
jgi:hypothetical protein